MTDALRKIHALCVHPRGHYQLALGAANCWDQDRDANTYNDDGAIIAHPPCGPWGRLSHMCTQQDHMVAFHCVDMVRRNGGVLEHPAHSKLWDAAGLPQPGEFVDEYGGFTVRTTLGAFGAPVMKPTWVYICRISGLVDLPYRTTPITRTVDSLSSWQRQITPIKMVRWMIDLAQRTEKAEIQCN